MSSLLARRLTTLAPVRSLSYGAQRPKIESCNGGPPGPGNPPRPDYEGYHATFNPPFTTGEVRKTLWIPLTVGTGLVVGSIWWAQKRAGFIK